MKASRRHEQFWEAWLPSDMPHADPAAWWTLLALALTLAFAIMALGALHLPVLVVTAAGATLSALIALGGGMRKIDRAPTLLLALGVWSLVQACPLPLPLLRVLAPKNAQIWSRAFEVAGTANRWASISLDPGASVVEALKWSSYAAAAVASGYVVKHLGLRFIAGLTFLLAVLVALTTALHGLTHAHALYGFYVPTFDPGPWGFGPIFNPNNRAGYLNLGAFAGLSLLASRDERWWRWPITIGVGCLVAISVLAKSRGGLGALAVGSLFLVVSLLRRAKHARDARRRHLYLRVAVPPLLALMGGVALAGLGSPEKTWDTLRHEGLSKLHVFWWTRPMLADFPFFGVGRGAFETVFPAYQRVGANVIHHHAENFVMDWICDWGLLAAVPALLAFGSMLRRHRHEQPSRTVLRLALGVLLLQNLVDHALETPAIMMLAAAILAALSAESRDSTLAAEPDEEIPGVEVGTFAPRRAGLALAMSALILGAIQWGRHSAYDDRRLLSSAFRQLSPEDEEDARLLLGKISDSVMRHPADAFLPLLGAITARHVPGTRPVRWLGWALERDMMSGHGHMAAAYFLLKVGAIDQAFVELRTAAKLDPSLQSRAADWAVRYAREAADVMRVVPDGQDGIPMLIALSASPRLAAQRFDLLEMATERDPSSMTAQTLAAHAFLEALENQNTTVCHFAQQASCVERLNRHILAIAHLAPRDAMATEMTARMLAATGRATEGRALLSSNCSTFLAPAHCWQTRITLAQDQMADLALQDAIRAYYATACTTDEECIRASFWLGGALETRGDFMGALEYYNRALRAGGDDARTWLAIARAARSAGQLRRAADALRRAQGTTDDPRVQHAADRAMLDSLAQDRSTTNGSP
ncbi:MAG TPA: O-antigen ligase family protein [Polyangiaceae bacterium]|nr:O-antigen ligase family protein [Polyangiaceae bacterium]